MLKTRILVPSNLTLGTIYQLGTIFSASYPQYDRTMSKQSVNSFHNCGIFNLLAIALIRCMPGRISIPSLTSV